MIHQQIVCISSFHSFSDQSVEKVAHAHAPCKAQSKAVLGVPKCYSYAIQCTHVCGVHGNNIESQELQITVGVFDENPFCHNIVAMQVPARIHRALWCATST